MVFLSRQSAPKGGGGDFVFCSVLYPRSRKELAHSKALRMFAGSMSTTRIYLRRGAQGLHGVVYRGSVCVVERDE